MGDSADLLKSKAILWMAPVGETLPDPSTIGFGVAWGGNWAQVGWTNAPLKAFYTDERHVTKVEEFLAPVKDWRISEEVKLETVLAEFKADHFVLLADGTVVTTAAGSGQVGVDELSIGGNAVVTQYAVGFEALRIDSAGVNQSVRYFVPIATFKGNGELEWSQKTDSYVNIPITLMGFVDTATGIISKLEVVTAAATS